MSTYFENYNEEISQVLHRASKEKNKLILRINLSTNISIQAENNHITDVVLESIHGLNMHLLSRSGYLVYGHTDKTYLPDIISRLYQNLDNLTKANKDHKVAEDIHIANLPDEAVNDFSYSSATTFDPEYLKELLLNIYTSLPQNIRENIDVTTKLCGYYSIWQINNTSKGRYEYDEFLLHFTTKISLKSNPCTSINLSTLIPSASFAEKNVDISYIINKITDYADILLNSTSLPKAKKISAEQIIFDPELTNVASFKFLRPNMSSKLAKKYKASIVSENSKCHIKEKFDKSGYVLSKSEDIDLTSGLMNEKFNIFCHDKCDPVNIRATRQKNFKDKIVFLYPNIIIEEKKKSKGFEFENLKELIEQIKKSKKPTLLLIGNSREIINNDDHIQPSLSLLIEKNDIHVVNIEDLDLSTIKEIDLMGDAHSSILKLNTAHELEIGMTSPKYLQIKDIEEIKII